MSSCRFTCQIDPLKQSHLDSMTVPPGTEIISSPQKMGQHKSSLKRTRSKSTYKHIPHREKAPVVVAKRNARERRRVQAVNSAFLRLRKHVPHENKNKRLSKVKTLKHAIDYIHQLQDLIDQHDTSVEESIIQRSGACQYVSHGLVVPGPSHRVAAGDSLHGPHRINCGDSSAEEVIFTKENQWMNANINHLHTARDMSYSSLTIHNKVHQGVYDHYYHG